MKNKNAEKFLQKKRVVKSTDPFDYFSLYEKENPMEQLKRIAGYRYEANRYPLKIRIIDLAVAKNPQGLVNAIWNAGFFLKIRNSYNFSILVRAN